MASAFVAICKTFGAAEKGLSPTAARGMIFACGRV